MLVRSLISESEKGSPRVNEQRDPSQFMVTDLLSDPKVTRS